MTHTDATITRPTLGAVSIGDIRLLTADDVRRLLAGQERAIVGCVGQAYEALADGRAVSPHSSFLRFAADSPDRIIALPAYLADTEEAAGIKWISSVPSNAERGLDRASAVIALNDRATGRLRAVLEGSIISAKRTAASAALAARHLCRGMAPSEIGLIGLGPINFEILRFLRAEFPGITQLHVYDVKPASVTSFVQRCGRLDPKLALTRHDSSLSVLRAGRLTSLATTATSPHIHTLEGVRPDSVVLHISLRDFAVDAILEANNIVDDVDHVCRSQTSVHLTAEHVGHRNFMTPLVDVIRQSPLSAPMMSRPTIMSPFGLGVLDVAVAALTLQRATAAGVGVVIPRFHPEHWTDRA